MCEARFYVSVAIAATVLPLQACTSNPSAEAPPALEEASEHEGDSLAEDDEKPAKPSARPAEWGYQGERSPEHWGELDPAYEACRLGVMQSPVDIPTEEIKKSASFEMSYGSAKVSISQNEHVDDIVDNGHTIQVTVLDEASLQTSKDTYTLKQFHFHTPSENAIDGKTYPMEVHLVHQSESGNFAVIAAFVEEGEANPVFQQLIDNFPDAPNTPNHIAGALDLSIHFADMDAFHFMGSFTTPPCTENVEWIVLKKPRTATKAQIAAFAERLDHNNRPHQLWGERSLSSNHLNSAKD